MAFKIPLTDEPCPRCLKLARENALPVEAVQRLPEGAFAPLARDKSGKCCRDCGAADSVLRMVSSVPGFAAARVVVANARREQYRMPGLPMGLVQVGLVAPSAPGDLEDQLAWLDKNNWFSLESKEEK